MIIGWDESARAPAHWLAEMHRGQPGWGHQPNYAVLVDTRDRPAPQITYVPQVTADQTQVPGLTFTTHLDFRKTSKL